MTTLLKAHTIQSSGATKYIAPILSYCLLSILAGLTPDTAFASASSEIFRSKAVLAIADRDYPGAIKLLDQAIAADPDDNQVYYYRGIVSSRLGDYKSAVIDLEVAQEEGVTQANLPFELGFVYYKLKDYPRATQTLAKGDAGNPRRNYYLGLAHVEQKQFKQALAPLQRAALSEDDMALAASFTQAEVLITLNEIDEARDVLHKLLARDSQAIYKDRAENLLDRIEKKEEAVKTLSAMVSVGMASDSNVGLYPNDQALPAGVSSKEDQRLQLNVDARWKPSFRQGHPLTLGYRLYQSLHNDLDAFDLQNHAITADWRQKQTKYEWGINFQLITSALDGNDYFDAMVLTPNIIFPHSDKRLSLGKLVWRDNDYTLPGLDGFDGTQLELSYRHIWLQGEQNHVYAGAGYKMDDTTDKQVASDTLSLTAGIRHVWMSMPLSAGYEYQQRDFGDASPSREDTISKINLGLSYPLDKNTHVDISVNQITNDSNSAAHEYDRNLFAIMFRWQL